MQARHRPTAATPAAEAAAIARDEQTSKAADALAAIEQHEKRARSLVDDTSRHAITGDYGTWAARQARAAFGWTMAAVIIGLGTAGALIALVADAADDSIQFTLYKTGVSIVGLIIAGYCARQAAEHRREERKAKRLALDLAALEPFLDGVENPAELRTEIARRVFAPEEVPERERHPA